MKIQARILLPVLGFMSAGMITISLILFTSASSEISSTVNSQVELLASELKTVLDEYIKDEKNNITLYSQMPAFTSITGSDWQAGLANAEIDRIVGIKAEYETVGLADLDGNVIACSDRSMIGAANIVSREYFIRSAGGELTSSDVLKSKASGNPVTVFSAPVLHNCEVSGVFFATVDISGFNSKYVDTVKIGTSGYAYITQSDGSVVAYPDKSRLLELNIRDYSFGIEMLAQQSGLYSYEFNGIEKTVGFRTASENGWMIAVTADNNDILMQG